MGKTGLALLLLAAAALALIWALGGDEAAIEDETLEVLGELLTHEDAFALGNYSRLGQLETALEEWAAAAAGEHDDVIDEVRERVHEACDGYPDDGEDSQARRCRDFLT